MKERITEFVEEIAEKIIAYRRDFHKYPEVGWTEFRTASKIARKLKELGFDVKLGRDVIKDEDRMGVPTEEELKSHYKRALDQGADEEFIKPLKGGFTGVVGTFNFGNGPVIALRFDIDALKIKEHTGEEHLPTKLGFSSINEGVMHSCGHDCHAAIGLGVAEALAHFKKEIKGAGKIKLIFQPAEEGVRGAKGMVGAGILDDVDYIIGAHIIAMEPGILVCGDNGFMATTKLDVSFKGLASHAGGAPNEGKNTMLAACTAILNLNSIPRHKKGDSRVNVGTLISGTDRNIIPEDSFMKVETRGETTEVNKYLEEYAYRIIENSAKMHNVDYKISHVGSAPSGVCSDKLVKKVEKIGNDLGCFDKIIETSEDSAGSEDFVHMMNRVQEKGGQGVYFIVGTDGKTGHHNSLFDVKEDDLLKVVDIFTLLVLDIIRSEDK